MNLDNLKLKISRSFDNLKLRISRELSNMDVFKLKKGIRETFWMFYFLPAMASLVTALILMVLHIDWYFLVPAVLLVGYSLQNLLFFMKYGKRKKNYHAGSE